MSKEITPEEAQETLEFIIDTFNKLAQKPQDIGLMFKFGEAHEKINQALDRLEQLEKENQELRNKLNINFEDCADELCEALTQRDKLYDENLELQKENQWLKDLIKEYKRLKELANQVIEKFQIGNKNLTEENEKYKKVIAWLKNTFEITLDSKVRISDGTDCIQAFPIDLKTNEVIYDLLKEVLEWHLKKH